MTGDPHSYGLHTSHPRSVICEILISRCFWDASGYFRAAQWLDLRPESEDTRARRRGRHVERQRETHEHNRVRPGREVGREIDGWRKPPHKADDALWPLQPGHQR